MRLSVLAVFLAAVASASAVSFFSVVLEEWESFKVRQYSETYNSTQALHPCTIIVRLLKVIMVVAYICSRIWNYILESFY